MKLFIPELGTKIRLDKDFTFNLIGEYRNEKFANTLGLELEGVRTELDSETNEIVRNYGYKDVFFKKGYRDKLNSISYAGNDETWMEKIYKFESENKKEFFVGETYSCTLPAGTILSFDRIYIRKGQSDYSSISFIGENKNISKNKFRFFVKLEEANDIEYSLA